MVFNVFTQGGIAPNALGTFGTAPRNMMRGPGLVTLDAGLMKNFRIKDRGGLPFGKISSAGSPRIVQLALKLSFSRERRHI